MPSIPLVKSILASASSSSSTIIQIKYWQSSTHNNNFYDNQICKQKQLFCFAKNKLSSGLLVVEKNQKNYMEPVKCYCNQFEFISTVVNSIQQSPHKLFAIASNGKMNNEELSLVKQELVELVNQVDDKKQIEAMTSESVFVFVYHGLNNQYSLDVNQTNSILDLKLNRMKQNYCKQFNHLQATVLQSKQSKPLNPFSKQSQTITHEIRIKNNGVVSWPQSIQMISFWNENVIVKSISTVPSLLVNEETIIKIELEYKRVNANNKMIFRLSTIDGHVFGDVISIDPITTNIISGSKDEPIKVWNSANQQLISACKNNSNRSEVMCVITWDKEKVIGGYENGNISIWNTITQQLEYTFQMAHTICVLCLYKLDENRFVSGSEDNTLNIWNMKTKECIHTLIGHTEKVTCVDKINNETIVSGSFDRTIKLWNVNNGKCINTIQTDHSIGILSIVVLSNKQYIVSGDKNGELKVWNIQNNKCITTLNGHSKWIWSILLMNENQIINGSNDKTIRIWNTKTWKCESVIQNDSFVLCLEKLNEELIASGDYKGNIKIWNIKTKQCILQWEAHSEWITSLCIQ